MKEFTLHVPKKLNDLTPISRVWLAETEKSFIRKFGGFTKQDVAGAWLDERTDTLYSEPMTRYTIASENDNTYAEFVTKAIPAMRDELKQECMYFVDLSGNVHFI